MKRGDVVVIDFPYKTGGAKVRPALIVQNDRDNVRTTSTIVVLITGNLKRINEPTYFEVDPKTTEGAISGLHRASLVNCSHFFTIDKSDVQKTIGRLSTSMMKRIDDCLRIALGL